MSNSNWLALICTRGAEAIGAYGIIASSIGADYIKCEGIAASSSWSIDIVIGAMDMLLDSSRSIIIDGSGGAAESFCEGSERLLFDDGAAPKNADGGAADFFDTLGIAADLLTERDGC